MKLKRFRLNALSAETLRQKEMNAIVGGNSCGCGCAYEDRGGSSFANNMNANYKNGYTSNNICNIVERTDYYMQVVCRPKAS